MWPANTTACSFTREVTHTKQGAEILSRFVLDICACEALWTPANIVDDAIAHGACAGGRSQSIARACRVVLTPRWLLRCCIKPLAVSLTCVFVDHGLLRLHEGDQVMRMFADNMGVKVIPC